MAEKKTVFFSGTIQFHALWSNDPVGNYPLAGYPTALLALLSIKCFTDYCSSKSKTSSSIILLVVLFTAAILYYEINLALIPMALAYYLTRSGASRLKKYTVFLVFLGSLMLLILVINKTSDYTGTRILISWKMVQVFFVSLLSALPLSVAPLTIAGSSPFVANHEMVFCAGISVLISLLFFSYCMRAREFSKLWDSKIKSTTSNNLYIPNLTMYILSVLLVTSSLEKYQSELTRIGQTYLYYSILHVCGAAILAKITLRNINKLRYLIIAMIFLLTNIMNTGNVNALEAANKVPSNLVASLSQPPGINSCGDIGRLNNFGWPIYYLDIFREGLEIRSFEMWGQYFCAKQFTKNDELR